MTRVCSQCPAPITARSKGMCRSCAGKQPVDPDRRARIAAGQRKRWERDLADPAIRAGLIESGKRLRASGGSLQPEAMAKAVASRRARWWCPKGYEDFNALLKLKGFLADERRKLVLEKRDADEKARKAALSPLERQIDRMRNGAVVTSPIVHRGAHDFTLGGIASGML